MAATNRISGTAPALAVVAGCATALVRSPFDAAGPELAAPAGALAELKARGAGAVVSAGLGGRDGAPVYRARVLRDGRIRTAAVDARSGEVVLDGGDD